MKITSRQKQALGAAFVTSGVVGDDACVLHVCLHLSPLSMPDSSKVKHGFNAKLISLGKTVYSLTAQRPFSENFLASLLLLAGLSVNFW